MRSSAPLALGLVLAMELLLLRGGAAFDLPLVEDSAEDGDDGDLAQGDAADDRLLATATAGSTGVAAGACVERLAACTGPQRPAQRRPVCGSDGATYSSRCHLLRAQCKGIAVAVKHKGACKDAKPCWTDRRHAQLIPRPPQVQLFEPRCLDDGSYAPVQCHNETGYCWCVTPQGRPVPNTSKRNKVPNCARRGKSGTRRRSSAAGRKNKKGCGRNEKSLFVNSIMQHFRAEYGRLPIPDLALGSSSAESSAEASGAAPPSALPLSASAQSPAASASSQPASERAVLAWKFSAMDRDGDAFLDRAEIAELRRLVRRAVKPKRCARLFPRLCDRDADRRVSREEWSACLGLDFNLLQGSMSTRPGLGDESPDTKEEPEANDCLSDRKTALEEQVSGTSGLYIPECTPDGRYKKVQCYTSTGYCWCVYEDTGIVIPGTSVKDQKPNCDIVPPPSRPMAGCPEPRKQIFLKEFLDYMKKKMLSTKEKSVTESEFLNLNGGSEEAVATWAFQNLDKNKNKIWERKEWKSFRTLVMSQPALRRCGKRLPRYCDVNNDQKISLTEWLNCVKNHQNSSAMSLRTPNNASRNGTNPLMVYLKSS